MRHGEAAVCYSSVYEDQAECICREDRIFVKGYLKDADHREPEGGIPYGLEYIFEDNRIRIRAEWKEDGSSARWSAAAGSWPSARRMASSSAGRRREGTCDRLIKAADSPSAGTERIFSLVPGFSALRRSLLPQREGRS